ncbi:serine hydrolase [Flavobacterium sp. NG2]|uniref:serine hydrolase domain-containing protein n=1 Tax=Flavobacterium sp. NG2 TaxID=3097547 RepID=UPI002A8046FB|nr:serine hydrolase [Flavobacterium sp. NG2]WPR72313.1 serine hydrolase [Flavobacterium sp. NG2]
MKRIVKFSILTIAFILIYFGWTTYPKLDLISGFSSKNVASAYFIDNRSLEQIEAEDNDIDLVRFATNSIYGKDQYSTASVFGIRKRKTIYHEGLGATLINDDFDTNKPYLVPKRLPSKPGFYPYGDLKPRDTVFTNINYQTLNTAVKNAFDIGDQKHKRTRAVVVIYKDKIVAEKYASGFNEKSKLLGWSMTKSVTSAIFGVLAKQGKFDIYKPAPIPEWQRDSRKYITTHNLLQMNSGLAWVENYKTICDVTRMLFQSKDMGKVQLHKLATYNPNTHWNYSSGTTNLLAKILRGEFKNHQDYLDFWYTNLIDKIGMHSMLIETDMTGNYVGSSYGWATARDWGKFGLLYLHQGNWNGEQILDSTWVDYSKTPTATSKNGYGAHFWLNAGGKFPDVPRDMYYCSGFQGQMIAIIPSKELVIVRLGLKGDEGFDFNLFLKEIVASIKK